MDGMTRVAEWVFRDKSNEDLYGLFHATLPGDAGEALCPAVNGKQGDSLPVEYPVSTSQSSKCQKRPEARVATRNHRVMLVKPLHPQGNTKSALFFSEKCIY